MNSRRLARLIHPGFRFGADDPERAEKLAALGVGGFCFYAGAAEDYLSLSRRLKAASATPLLISSDFENGAGQRARGATELPANMAIGASGDEALARRKGEITALEARELGVDWVLAPVLDLATRADNPIVNVRAYGADPALVSRLAGAYMSGLGSQGALNCAKHFPGHGPAASDSHLELPVVGRNLHALEQEELRPFRALAARADAVMAAHLLLPELAPSAPASLSREVLTGLLRKGLGYNGFIVTDALEMKAVSADPQAGVKALLAGADALLVPEDPFALLEELSRAYNDGLLPGPLVDAALARQDALVRRLAPFRSAPAPDALGCPEHRAFNAEAAPACLAWASAGRFAFRPGETIGYFEPLAAQRDWKGAAFVEELARLGARVEPYQPGCGMRLAAGLFGGPRAGSGSINLGDGEWRALESAVAGASDSVLLAFGSPFALNGLAPSAALCAFCALGEFQRAAAGALAGKVSPGGTLPVKISMRRKT